MKKATLIILVGFVGLLAGCAHIKIVSFDNNSRTVVVQGGKWAKDEDYEKAAKEWCKSDSVALQNMNQRTIGSYTTTSGSTSVSGSTYGNNFNGNGSYSGSSTTVGIQRYDRTYKCN